MCIHLSIYLFRRRPSGVFGFRARFVTDNYAYEVEGRYTTITNTDWFITTGVKGLAVRAGITTNGWNSSRDGGRVVPELLPNFSIILYQ